MCIRSVTGPQKFRMMSSVREGGSSGAVKGTHLCDVFMLCLQEVNFGMVDCSDDSILKGLETLLTRVMLPALRSQQVRD